MNETWTSLHARWAISSSANIFLMFSSQRVLSEQYLDNLEWMIQVINITLNSWKLLKTLENISFMPTSIILADFMTWPVVEDWIEAMSIKRIQWVETFIGSICSSWSSPPGWSCHMSYDCCHYWIDTVDWWENEATLSWGWLFQSKITHQQLSRHNCSSPQSLTIHP